jgi:hypothetical protein
LSLSLVEARQLPETELRERFTAIALDLVERHDETLPESFPKRPGTMTRSEMLAAVTEHAYLFDRDGGQCRSAFFDDAT